MQGTTDASEADCILTSLVSDDIGGRDTSSIARRTTILGHDETFPGRHLCLSGARRAESRSIRGTTEPGRQRGSRCRCTAQRGRLPRGYTGRIDLAAVVRPGHFEIAIRQRRSIKGSRNDEALGKPATRPSERTTTGQSYLDESGFELDGGDGFDDTPTTGRWHGYHATQDWPTGLVDTETRTRGIPRTFTLTGDVMHSCSLGTRTQETPFDFDSFSFIDAHEHIRRYSTAIQQHLRRYYILYNQLFPSPFTISSTVLSYRLFILRLCLLLLLCKTRRVR